jgi:P-type Cu2+ transporter
MSEPHAHAADTPATQDGSHDGAHGSGKHAGHHTEAFRRRFWWCLLLTVPVVATSHMVMDWFGYELDFPGMEWVGPVFGSVIFFWGGRPFLEGGWREIKDRQPGMMLLISMAITIAYVASMATSLDAFDLDFWCVSTIVVALNAQLLRRVELPPRALDGDRVAPTTSKEEVSP